MHFYNMSIILRRTAALVLATAACIAVRAQDGVPTLSLDRCIEIALTESPVVRVADMEITKADYSRKETLGALLPSIDFSGSYGRTLQKQVAYMDMDAFGDMSMPGTGTGTDEEATPQSRAGDKGGKKDTGFKMGLDNTYSLGFSAAVPLIAPQLWASLKLSDIQIARSVEQARASRLDLVNQVKNAYYALQLAIDSRRVVQESYDMARLTHDTYVKRHSAGDASEYEVLRTSVAMKNIEPEMIQGDIAVSRARMQLAILMGIDADTPYEIKGTLDSYDPEAISAAAVLSTDLMNNTSLAMNDIERRTLEKTLSMQRASLYPTLAATANYSWNSSSNGSPFRNFRWTSYSMVGLSVSIPLFQGGQRMARIKQARIGLEQIEYTRQNLVRQLNSQVTLAIDNIRLNEKQIASSRESVDEAARAHDIQQRSFQIGAASYLDLRDSELSLTRARLAYCQAVYNFMVAHADLELLLGNASLPENLTETSR